VGVKLLGKLRRAYREESPMGNLFADILRRATGTEVGLVNGGGLRADLPEGELRYGALFEALPFANRAATLTLTGAQLRELIANNLRSTGGVLSIAGAAVEARCQGSALAVSIRMTSGRVLGDGDKVSVGTSDFLALGGDDFSRIHPLEPPHIDDAGPTLRDLVATGLKARGQVEGSDPALYDPEHPHLKLPTARPVRCGTAAPVQP
jgi:5'-nucleotidase